jgi:hypothetical protein
MRMEGFAFPETEMHAGSETIPDGSKGPYKTPQGIFRLIGEGAMPRDYSKIRVPVLSIEDAQPAPGDYTGGIPLTAQERANTDAYRGHDSIREQVEEPLGRSSFGARRRSGRCRPLPVSEERGRGASRGADVRRRTPVMPDAMRATGGRNEGRTEGERAVAFRKSGSLRRDSGLAKQKIDAISLAYLHDAELRLLGAANLECLRR